MSPGVSRRQFVKAGAAVSAAAVVSGEAALAGVGSQAESTAPMLLVRSARPPVEVLPCDALLGEATAD